MPEQRNEPTAAYSDGSPPVSGGPVKPSQGTVRFRSAGGDQTATCPLPDGSLCETCPDCQADAINDAQWPDGGARIEVGFAECGDAVDLAEGFAAFYHHDKTSDRPALTEWMRQLHDELRKVLYGRA